VFSFVIEYVSLVGDNRFGADDQGDALHFRAVA